MSVLGARAELWLAGAAHAHAATSLRRLVNRQRALGLTGLAALLDAEQDRWFLWVPVFAGVGIGLYFALPFEPGWIGISAPLLAAIGLRMALSRGLFSLVLTAALLSTAVGFTAAKLRVEWMRGPVIGDHHRALTIHGWIEVVERRAEKGVRLTLRVAQIDGLADADTPTRVRVSSRYANLDVAAGDAVSMKAILRPPPEPAEPYGYDFARQAWFTGIGGVGFAVGRPVPDAAPGAMPTWTWVKTRIERLREDISLRITAALPGPSGLVTDALVTGEQKGIPQDITEAMRDSGLSHILAISGLQLTLLAGAVLTLTRKGLACVPSIALRWPVKKIATAFGLAAATFYLLISGCGSATSRAYVMIAVGLVAVLLDRPALSMRNLAIAALCLLIPAPETLLDPSFQMSFSAVVALMAAYEWAHGQQRGESVRSLRPKRPGRDDSWILHGFWYADLAWLILRETLAATTIATLAVAPFTLFTFHRLAIYGVLANAVAEPLFNLIIMPLVALVLVAMPFGLEAGPLFLVDFCVGGLLWIARSVSALPGSVALVPQMPVAALAAMTLGGAWLCLWKLGWRYLGLLGVAIGMLLTVGGAAPDILIGRDGTQIAYRLAGGELAALPGKGSAFDLAQWLEADADGRDASDVRSGAGARCDGLGCTALVKGMVLAVSDHPASLRDDCPDAQILILRYRQPAPCIGPLLVLDMRDLRVGGAHAVRIGAGGRPTVATVSDSRGDRPWSHSEHLGRRDSLIEDFSTPGWQHGTRPPRTARKPFKTHHGKSKPAPSEVASPAETAAHTTSEPMSSALADATPPAEFQQPQ